MDSLRIACIGECMIELWQQQPQLMTRTFGGDTLNTAVYAARSLRQTTAQVDYVTALGDDPFSDELLAAWQATGVGIQRVLRLPGELPGLYMIRTTSEGERSFYYWRENAAARKLLANPQADALLQTLSEYDFIYLSGITLAILDDASRVKLLALLERVRSNGGQVGFDSNYRPRLWPEKASAREWMMRTLEYCSMALPTFDDEVNLYNDAAPQITAARLHGYGVAEVVVKQGPEPCLVSTPTQQNFIPVADVVTPVDTTAAGDAFNGAYFSARLLGEDAIAAANLAHRLAGQVIMHKGAIIPD